MPFHNTTDITAQLADRAGISMDKMGYGEGNIDALVKLVIDEVCQHLTNIGQDYCREQVEKHFIGGRHKHD